ncbi:hypothetical protein [Pseudoroseomonas cervicalis]|uniref:hypothetical protein n=1 Tax=Teichococcus cervicalis TaxID=204525 RepID=UPI0022F18EE2|nr:hypothetical protein [Pseudoroseomonas cervicalis]WBV41442.1 hypothetical protein PFY06_09255 [Pseudoroseomonas cervicalis]
MAEPSERRPSGPDQPAGPAPADAAPPAEAEWHKPQRPVFHPEEGGGDRSDWGSMAKAALLVLAGIAAIAWLLSR